MKKAKNPRLVLGNQSLEITREQKVSFTSPPPLFARSPKMRGFTKKEINDRF